MAFFTINELSLTKCNERKDAVALLVQFASVSQILLSIGFNGVRLWDKSSFLNFEICDNLRVSEWLKNNSTLTKKEKLSSQLLKSLLTKTSLFNWTEEDRSIIERCPIIGVKVEQEEHIPSGLKVALFYKTIAVSLLSHEKWDCSSIELLYLDEEENSTIEQIVTVNHASKPIHIEEQGNWLSSILQTESVTTWNPSQTIFPNLAFSNLLVNGNWNQFHEEKMKAKTKEEIRAIIIKYANRVAERNFYRHDNNLSFLNSTTDKKRRIYIAGIGRERIHLSVDLEKGGFEVCDFNGDHLGEFFFDGNRTSEAKPDHGIKLR